MKLSELTPCAVCKGKILPVWYRLRISQAMMKPNAARGVLGLTETLGGIDNPGALAVAETMAPEPDCIMILGDEEPALMTEINICQECFLMKSINLGVLIESAHGEVRIS